MRPFRFIVLLILNFAIVSSFSEEFNTLSPTEKAQGWQLMFDGKSLDGWHSYRQTTITTGKWAIADSAIYRKEQGANAILAPNQFAFQDFEISIDWKVPDIGNSGIFLRYLETEESENVRTGPESQICGKQHLDYGQGTALTSPGACYAMYPPAVAWIKPADQYNTFRVVAYGKRIAHFGNGIRLLQYEIGSADWTTRFEASKYKFFPLYGDVHAGKLFLQDHGSPVWFRNLKIRPLTKDPWTDSTFQWPDQVSAIRWTGHHNAKLALRSSTMSGNRILFRNSTVSGTPAWFDLVGHAGLVLPNQGENNYFWETSPTHAGRDTGAEK